jgi:hypothetical protein
MAAPRSSAWTLSGRNRRGTRSLFATAAPRPLHPEGLVLTLSGHRGRSTPIRSNTGHRRSNQMTRAVDRRTLERPTPEEILLALDGAGCPVRRTTRKGRQTRLAASQGLEERT